MSYDSNIKYMIDIICEAQQDKIDPETAKRWATQHLYEYDSYNDIKDLAFHMGVTSVEVAHPSTVKASLIALMTKEMLKPFKEEE